MVSLAKITEYFRDDYFTFSRKVVGLDEKILEKPIEEGKVKYINLLTTPMKIQDFNDKKSSVKSVLILESRPSYALRIISFVTLIFPLIGLVFCLLNKQETKVSPELKKNWGNRFVKGNAKVFDVEMNHFIKHAIKSSINPLIFKEESFLLTGRLYLGAPDLSRFYQESHLGSGREAYNKPEKTLKVPRKERVHFKYQNITINVHAPHAVTSKELRGSVMVLAPYHSLEKKFPKALEFYLKYLEKKQKANPIT